MYIIKTTMSVHVVDLIKTITYLSLDTIDNPNLYSIHRFTSNNSYIYRQ